MIFNNWLSPESLYKIQVHPLTVIGGACFAPYKIANNISDEMLVVFIILKDLHVVV